MDAVQQREQNKKRKYMNTDATTTVKLSGLTCHACQKLVTTYLKNIHGVKDAIVDLETGMTTITASRAINSNASLRGKIKEVLITNWS